MSPLTARLTAVAGLLASIGMVATWTLLGARHHHIGVWQRLAAIPFSICAAQLALQQWRSADDNI